MNQGEREQVGFLPMITRNRIGFSEKQAALIWRQLATKELLSTGHGPLEVVYPGRAAGGNGPDFRDAVIAHKLHMAKGDVEVHVKSSHWYSHGHHADAAYNGVILHVVTWHDCDSATLLQSGQPVPVLCLARALRHQPYLLPPQLPCFEILGRLDGQTLTRTLDAAGEERFREKARYFQDQVQREEPGQVLFRGMMRALGYARNTKPFEELADRVPLSALEATEGLAVKQALLLGRAGLLPSQRRLGKSLRGREIQELEQIWRSEGRGIEAMKEDDWSFSHIYPNNSPVRRLVAQSYLLERHCAEKRLAGILRLVKEASLAAGHRVLEKGLTVTAGGYWQHHFDFGMRSKTKIPALLGNSKAREMIINVILPFAFCWEERTDQPKLGANIMKLYHNYPKLAENCLTRHMRNQFGLEERFVLNACHQQGLIHIFRNYCREGRCSQCHLGSQASP